jgi:prepilin-type N-terminal cleavage/methylation domain-containing protein
MRGQRLRAAGRGFTLVELLVVVTIIGLLVALLLPAIQSAREAGRAAVCENNVKQLALACQSHQAALGYFPSGGWGFQCLGVPGRPPGPTQPGGWIFNVLPFMDQQTLYDGGGIANVQQAMQAIVATPLAILYCPTRRPCRAYHVAYPQWTPYSITAPTAVGRSDYAMSVSSSILDDPGPSSFLTTPSIASVQTDGVTGRAWWVSPSDITDGLSCTYLLGEKYIPPDCYTNGVNYGDNENAYIGSDRDTLRNTGDLSHQPMSPDYHPLRDRRGLDASYCFGSAHPMGFHMALCDGSVHRVPFTIDPLVHAQLGNRHDGTSVNVATAFP